MTLVLWIELQIITTCEYNPPSRAIYFIIFSVSFNINCGTFAFCLHCLRKSDVKYFHESPCICSSIEILHYLSQLIICIFEWQICLVNGHHTRRMLILLRFIYWCDLTWRFMISMFDTCRRCSIIFLFVFATLLEAILFGSAALCSRHLKNAIYAIGLNFECPTKWYVCFPSLIWNLWVEEQNGFFFWYYVL